MLLSKMTGQNLGWVRPCCLQVPAWRLIFVCSFLAVSFSLCWRLCSSEIWASLIFPSIPVSTPVSDYEVSILFGLVLVYLGKVKWKAAGTKACRWFLIRGELMKIWWIWRGCVVQWWRVSRCPTCPVALICDINKDHGWSFGSDVCKPLYRWVVEISFFVWLLWL